MNNVFIPPSHWVGECAGLRIPPLSLSEAHPLLFLLMRRLPVLRVSPFKNRVSRKPGQSPPPGPQAAQCGAWFVERVLASRMWLDGTYHDGFFWIRTSLSGGIDVEGVRQLKPHTGKGRRVTRRQTRSHEEKNVRPARPAETRTDTRFRYFRR